jgi:hypothetical protein
VYTVTAADATIELPVFAKGTWDVQAVFADDRVQTLTAGLATVTADTTRRIDVPAED